MLQDHRYQSALQKLIEEDAIGQLRQRTGRMAALGSEDGILKLDWVEGVSRLLADTTKLEQIEAEARSIRQRGIRHIIWAGMGGSVLTVQVMAALGFCGGRADGEAQSSSTNPAITVYPLDSTDPAALNAIVRQIAAAKQLELPTPLADTAQNQAASPGFLRALLQDVMMVGVAMGMTSEEPITHLEWFLELLQEASLPPSEHLLAMTLPGSSLDHFAQQQVIPSLPLQPDGGAGTGGRMSAPSTHVFLLPAALYLAQHIEALGQLRAILQQAWNEYNLDAATINPAEHPFVKLAAAMSSSSTSHNGACRLLLKFPERWRSLIAWIEQLMEESLGKGGKGVVIFEEQHLNPNAPCFLQQDDLLHVEVTTEPVQTATADMFLLVQPARATHEPLHQLATLAASFLNWQLTMALYGYLQDITFAGQPAVEQYKARARVLRNQPDPLQVAASWQSVMHADDLTLLTPPTASSLWQERTNTSEADLAALVAAALSQSAEAHTLGYLDVTINGFASERKLALLHEQALTLGNVGLGVPVKFRMAPAAYHSTEQSEMDGPANMVSLRLVAKHTEESLIGQYSNAFLHVQAVSTWQYMLEVNRACWLFVDDRSLDEATESLSSLLLHVQKALSHT